MTLDRRIAVALITSLLIQPAFLLKAQELDSISYDTLFQGGSYSLLGTSPEGHPVLFRDPEAMQTRWERDQYGRLTKEILPNGESRSWTWSFVGSISQYQDPQGRFHDFGYDRKGRLTARNGPGTLLETYDYDENDRLTKARNRASTLTFDYDEIGQPVMAGQDNYKTFIQYDENHKINGLLYPGGLLVNYMRDPSGQTSHVIIGSDTLATYYYDQFNREILRDLSANGTFTETDYAEEEQIIRLMHGPDNFVAFEYEYNDAGNRFLEHRYHDPGRSRLTWYDRAGNPVTIRQGKIESGKIRKKTAEKRFTYDAAGNRLSETKIGPPMAYRLDSLGGYIRMDDGIPFQLEYDRSGNLIRKGGTHFKYDERNRLIEVQAEEGGKLRSIASYQWDPMGRRVRRMVSGDTLQFIYFRDKIIEIRDQDNKLRSSVIYDPQFKYPLAVNRFGRYFFYHHNGQGSVYAITDQKGKVVQRYSYDRFGNREQVENAGSSLMLARISNSFGFGGMYFDPETGFYINGARFFDPVIGRSITYLQPDEGISNHPVLSLPQWENISEVQGRKVNLGLGSTEEGILEIWARKAANGHGHPFSSGEDFLCQLEAHSGEGSCFQKLFVFTHGWGWPTTKGRYVNGGFYGTLWINGFLADFPPGKKGPGFVLTDAARELRDLEKAMATNKVSFCADCEIILTGCRIGNTGDFVQRLSRITGCTVISSYGGSDGTQEPLFQSAPKTQKELEEGGYRGYTKTYPNGIEVEIGMELKLW